MKCKFTLFITALLELLIKNQKVKTIIGTAAAFSFFIVIFVFSFMSGFKSGENSQASMFMTVGNAAHYINPSLFFLEWTFEGNPLWSLVYVGSNLALLIIVLSIIRNRSCVFVVKFKVSVGYWVLKVCTS